MIRRQIFTLAWPVIIQNSVGIFMYIADTAMLGRVGVSALAVIGLAGPILFICGAILSSLIAPAVAVVSRAYGQKDKIKQEQDSATALAIGVFMGIALTLVGVFLLPYLAYFLQPKDGAEVVKITKQYVAIVSMSFLFSSISIVCTGILRATGDTRTPFRVGLFATGVNLLLNYLLIYGNWGFPRLEAIGSAIGALCASVYSAIALLSYLCSKRSPIPLSIASFGLVIPHSIKRFMKVAIPAFIEPVIITLGLLIYTKIIAALGAFSLATHRTILSAESIAFLPGLGFAAAASILVGQCLGARDPARAEVSAKESARLSVYLMSLFGIIFLLFAPFIIRFFSGQEEVIWLGSLCLMVAAFEQPFLAIVICLGGALRGAGDTRSPLVVSTIGMYLVRIPLSYILGIQFGWGLVGIWIMMPFDWLTQALLLGIIFHKGKWKRLKL